MSVRQSLNTYTQDVDQSVEREVDGKEGGNGGGYSKEGGNGGWAGRREEDMRDRPV